MSSKECLMLTCFKNYLNVASERQQTIIQVYFQLVTRRFLKLIFLKECIFRFNECFADWDIKKKIKLNRENP